jgi:electron transfer flavoprotein beta subunit
MGCDQAYLISDPRFKDADISVTARILAAAIEKLEGADLVVAGRESADTGAGQIGPRLAEVLGYAQVTDVHALEAESNRLRATRRWQGGYASVETALPAVVTIAPEAFPPRHPHGARIMSAYREWSVQVWTAKDLALDDTVLVPLLAFRGESFAPPIEVGEKFQGAPVEVAREVIAALRLQKAID